MKKRNIILIIVTGAIILAAGVVALIKWNEAAGNTYNSEYNIEDTAAINKIFIADKQDNMVTLTRNSASSWTIDGQYPASQPMVDLLLKTLKDMRKRSDVNRNAVPNVIAYQIPYEQSGNQDTYDRIDKQTVVLTAHGQVSVYGAVDK